METKTQIRKRDIIILVLTIAIIIAIVVFCALNWELVTKLFGLIVEGKTIVQDYILSFGVMGEIVISIMLIFCFFFPFISSLPLQIVCLMAYGLVHATILISVVIALASQFLYLLERNFKTFFYTKKQHEKQKEIEERIKNSKRNIDLVMVLFYIVPCIPFLIISSVACRSNMKWWKYTMYTALGPIPEVIVTLLLGNQVTSNSSPVLSVIILILMILIVILSLIFKDKMIYFIFKPKENLKLETNTNSSSENPSNNNVVNDDVKTNNINNSNLSKTQELEPAKQNTKNPKSKNKAKQNKGENK